MLSIASPIVMFASFIALLVLIWRVSKRPHWRIRAVIYGWGAFILLSLFWCLLLPAFFNSVLDVHVPAGTFPDGTFAVGALVLGWMWPAILVIISSYYDRKQRGDDHVA